MRMDHRKTGKGALNGWATRRGRQRADREALIGVMDEIGGICVHGVSATDHPGKFLIGAVTLIGWRDRIARAVGIRQ